MKLVGAGQPVFLAVLLLISNCVIAVGQNSTNEFDHLRQEVEKLHQEGKYAEALPLALHALDIAERNDGSNAFNTAVGLSWAATVYEGMGDYSKAEPFYRRALVILEKVLGREHPDIAQSLNNLALLYVKMGDYGKAEPLSERALNIVEKALGPEHLDTARNLNSRAGLYNETGAYANAVRLYKRALGIWEKALGREHPDTVIVLHNLAGCYFDMNDFTKAEQHYLRVLKIREAKLGQEHLDTAQSLNNLAAIYQSTGDGIKAEQMYRRSLNIHEKVLGLDHPDTSKVMFNLALQQLDLGHSDMAHSFAVKHRAASEKNLGMILAFTSERQRMAYQRSEDFHVLMGTLGSASELGEILLRTKGVVLDSLLEDQMTAAASKDPKIKKVADQLRVEGDRLIQLQLEIPEDPATLKRRQTERELLEQQVEDLQQKLARNVASLGHTRRSLHITMGEVQAVLPKDTVLMEFVYYKHYIGKRNYEPRYGVVLIGNPQMTFKDAKPGEPVWVPLGSAAAIEQSLKEYGSMMRGAKEGGINLLRTLYTQLFEPIQKRLPKGITTLIISPDAELNFVSFATFINDQDKFLAEQYAVEYVASGRDLVLKRPAKKASRRFAAFANPAFGEKPMLAGTHSTNAVQLAMLSSDQRDYKGEILKPLPNTLREVQFLRDRSSSWNMDGSVFAGAEASEAEVKAVKSPYILHLATHGFFLPDTMTTNSTGRQLLGNDRAPIVPRNPMQRSGLAFAGAQLTLDAWKRGETPDTENDGILMGQEIGTMDLKETWLVVLSACDTGIGEARAGEGVLGLRRGFIQAGTQNLLMTLWPVSDKWTVDLMKAFYERALKDNNAPQALAEVQRQWLIQLKKEDMLTAARLAGPFILTFQGSN